MVTPQLWSKPALNEANSSPPETATGVVEHARPAGELLEELARERVLLEQERERSARAEERSLVLQEVSKRVASAHNTDELFDLIVNEAGLY